MQRKFALGQLMLAVIFTTLLPANRTFCRYSVRDVGFVNVHGQPWQLKIIRPDNVSDDELARRQTSLETLLADSNVTNEWVRAESVDGKKLVQLFEDSSDDSAWMAAIYGPDDRVFLVDIPNANGFDSINATVQSILNSTRREKILDQITTALCVIVVVECGDATQDKKVVEVAVAAAAQISRQMWMMEKPTKIGPVVEIISANEREQEKWMLNSLGLNPAEADPQLVIVYGQGRRLGDVFVGPDIVGSTIAKVAALCGQSCECDLDRAWLYGTQMIHIWGADRELKAEENLDFDPGAALVLAEVNGIVNGANSENKRSDSLIGNGLVIHDFSDMDDVVANESGTEPDSNAEQGGQPESAEESMEESKSDTKLAERETTNSVATGKDLNGSPPSKNELAGEVQTNQPTSQPTWGSRWILLVIAGSIVLAVALFVVARGRE